MTKTGKNNRMKRKNIKTKPKKELTAQMENNKESTGNSKGSSSVLQKGSKRKVETVNATGSDKRVKLNPKQVANGSGKRSRKPNQAELEVQDEETNSFQDFDELSNDSGTNLLFYIA